MSHNKTGLPGTAEPWGREVDKRLDVLERKSGIMADTLGGLQDSADKTVFAEFNTGQNIANGVTGKIALTTPTQVQYVSSTGLFEVTVSLTGLVSAGATLGVSFESELYPSDIYFENARYGVTASCANADTRWVPFSGSRSTVLSARPGVYTFSLYAVAYTTVTASAQAFINQTQLSVKAV